MPSSLTSIVNGYTLGLPEKNASFIEVIGCFEPKSIIMLFAPIDDHLVSILPSAAYEATFAVSCAVAEIEYVFSLTIGLVEFLSTSGRFGILTVNSLFFGLHEICEPMASVINDDGTIILPFISLAGKDSVTFLPSAMAYMLSAVTIIDLSLLETESVFEPLSISYEYPNCSRIFTIGT